jgi:hypothetical protein
MRTLFVFCLLLALNACATFRQAPRLGKTADIKAMPTCDEASDYTKVQGCTRNLANAYVDQVDQIQKYSTYAGRGLIGLAATAAGVELFKGSRAITKGAGLLSGTLSAEMAYAPPAVLANVLDEGKARLECALVKAEELRSQQQPYRGNYADMYAAYESANEAIDHAKAVGATSAAEDALLKQAMDGLYAACENTTASKISVEGEDASVAATADVGEKAEPNKEEKLAKKKEQERLSDTQIAHRLYAVAVSISDNVAYKFRGSYAAPATAIGVLDTKVAAIKAALVQSTTMTKKADEATATAAIVDPKAECQESAAAAVPPTSKPATKNTDQAVAKTKAACSVKKAAEAVREMANPVENIALTAQSLNVCAGVREQTP